MGKLITECLPGRSAGNFWNSPNQKWVMSYNVTQCPQFTAWSWTLTPQSSLTTHSRQRWSSSCWPQRRRWSRRRRDRCRTEPTRRTGTVPRTRANTCALFRSRRKRLRDSARNWTQALGARSPDYGGRPIRWPIWWNSWWRSTWTQMTRQTMLARRRPAYALSPESQTCVVTNTHTYTHTHFAYNTYTHRHTHTYVHIQIQTDTHHTYNTHVPHTHTTNTDHTHTPHTDIHTHTRTHTDIHAHTHHTQTYTHTHAHTHTHHTQTYTHTRTHAHTHTGTHRHTHRSVCDVYVVVGNVSRCQMQFLRGLCIAVCFYHFTWHIWNLVSNVLFMWSQSKEAIGFQEEISHC